MSQFVVRPGATDFDVQDRIQGALDLPLNACGLAQVEELVEKLRNERLDVIYTSPSEPSLSSAQMLGKGLGVVVKVLDGLANVDLGLWQGLARNEIRHKQPRVFRQWEEAPESVCPPCGEPPEELIARIEKSLRKPVRKGGSFAIVASDPVAGLVLRALRGHSSSVNCDASEPGTCSAVHALEHVEI
ncbi:histidine phosphatase family protein [Planctomicrobium sp. SH668]|uniref:histidine phosphatase family protein n=1 Tax=Planctomicrobium sp. SH668 TaxID=3448126 RepID=UPI003F5B70F7